MITIKNNLFINIYCTRIIYNFIKVTKGMWLATAFCNDWIFCCINRYALSWISHMCLLISDIFLELRAWQETLIVKLFNSFFNSFVSNGNHGILHLKHKALVLCDTNLICIVCLWFVFKKKLLGLCVWHLSLNNIYFFNTLCFTYIL